MPRPRGLVRAAALLIAAAALLGASRAASCRGGCGPHGACVSGVCACIANFTGARCGTHLQRVPKRPFPVPEAGGAFFAFPIARDAAGGVAAMIRVLGDVRSGATFPVLFAHAVPAGAPPPKFRDTPPFGALFRPTWAYDRGSFLARRTTQVVLLRTAKKGGTLYAAVYSATANASSFWWPARRQAAKVRLLVIECSSKRRRCRPPVRRPGSWTGSVAVLALPVVLGTLALLTIAACARACARVLRRTGRGHVHLPPVAAVRDRLAPAETDAMFPRFVFEKAHAVALGAAGEPSCAVCLSGYEEGELLRRLRCGHSYHAACLDEWLETNASCPRCRKPARIRIVVGSRLFALRVAVLRLLRGRNSDERIFGDASNAAAGVGPVV